MVRFFWGGRGFVFAEVSDGLGGGWGLKSALVVWERGLSRVSWLWGVGSFRQGVFSWIHSVFSFCRRAEWVRVVHGLRTQPVRRWRGGLWGVYGRWLRANSFTTEIARGHRKDGSFRFLMAVAT